MSYTAIERTNEPIRSWGNNSRVGKMEGGKDLTNKMEEKRREIGERKREYLRRKKTSGLM